MTVDIFAAYTIIISNLNYSNMKVHLLSLYNICFVIHPAVLYPGALQPSALRRRLLAPYVPLWLHRSASVRGYGMAGCLTPYMNTIQNLQFVFQIQKGCEHLEIQYQLHKYRICKKTLSCLQCHVQTTLSGA